MICANQVNCRVESSVTSIQKSDVSSLSDSLETLTFAVDSKLTTIEEDSFSYFIVLNEVDLTNCVKLESIYQDTFYNCRNLKTVTLPKDGILSTLLGGCFAFTGIKTITFPKSLKYLYKHNSSANTGAFSSSPLSSINYYTENNLEIIHSYSFRATNLTEFELGTHVSSIFGSSFEGSGLYFKKFIQKSDNVNGYYIDNGALYKDKNLVFCPPALTNIELAEGTESIGSEAFMMNTMKECTFLKSPLKTISGYAFYSCSNLRKIVFPPTLQTISFQSLCYCKKLEFVSFSGNISVIPSQSLFSCVSLKIVIIPDGVEEIQSMAFKGCTSLNYIYIPDTVTKISSDAFQESGITRCGIICSNAEKEIIKTQTQMKDSSFELCSKKLMTKYNSCSKASFLSNYIFLLVIYS